MTRSEFAKIMAWLTTAVRKPIVEGVGELADAERRASMDCYFEMLGDLPAEVLDLAARRVAVAHPWATFPSIAELREMAAASARGEIQMTTAGEAWGMALAAAKKIDPDHRGPYMARGKDGTLRRFDSQAQWACDGFPPLVLEAMRHFGVTELANADPNFARKEFVKIFEGLASREEKRRLLPANVAKALDLVREKQSLPAPLAKVVKALGLEPS